ncbi:MAG: ribonuclease HII [Euryarchaeota archaeon]|nr:ribonuclease HII [Euryarchaeota archaeon]|tara:strand:+ start:14922 stop:15659 length:738 start_codon:yes stop_codon:yes gene_type:complete
MMGPHAGVDEAGRGPALGPLVVCSLCIPSEDVGFLRGIGARDSKSISPRKRKGVYNKIIEEAGNRNWGLGIVFCEPSRIDGNSINSDLNSLEVNLFAEALELSTGPIPSGSIKVDACDVDESRFGSRLSKILGRRWRDWDIDSKHGMDSMDVVTGAASIIAKVERDSKIYDLSKELGLDLGSGYPSDPKTRLAVDGLVSGELPHDCLRWSWKTVSNAWNEAHGTPIPLRCEDGEIVSQSNLGDWE